MASTTSKTYCNVCTKGAGLFQCQGCKQMFCTKHVVEHRQTLNYQLEEIISDHDSLQDKVVKNSSKNNALLISVDEWERLSIMKIQQMARECREKLMELENLRNRTLSNELNLFTERIKEARENDSFFENDLNNWTLALKKLKNETINNPLLNSILEDQSTPLVYELKIFSTHAEFENQSTFDYCSIKSENLIPQDVFEHCLNGANIEDNGQLVVHDTVDCPVEVRGKSSYSSGVHRFRLQIEKNPLKTWIFFGITSQQTAMTKNSYESPSTYGWADYDDYFLDGIRQSNHNRSYFNDTFVGDIIELTLDCNNQTISYMNERHQKHQQINIDVEKCPFPWQLHMNFYGRNDRVRLLSVINNF